MGTSFLSHFQVKMKESLSAVSSSYIYIYSYILSYILTIWILLVNEWKIVGLTGSDKSVLKIIKLNIQLNLKEILWFRLAGSDKFVLNFFFRKFNSSWIVKVNPNPNLRSLLPTDGEWLTGRRRVVRREQVSWSRSCQVMRWYWS
jgi:hypothetical protein